MARAGRDTAQRAGAATGIAVVGTVLPGSGSGQSSSRVTPGLVHTAQWATAAGLGFILLAMACALGLPRTLGAGRAGENA